MKIVGVYSFNDGEKAVQKKYEKEFDEVKKILTHVDATTHKTKASKEKTKRDKILYWACPKKVDTINVLMISRIPLG